MTVARNRPQLPFARSSVLELAPLYAVLRRETPVAAVTTPVGDPAWLVTRYREVRQLLGDPRLGRSHPEPRSASRLSDSAIMDGPTGDYATEQVNHQRMRRLTPAFSARRMHMLDDEIATLVDGYVDDLVAASAAADDGVVDLHAVLAMPLPVAVICRLLGAPVSGSGHLRALSDRMSSYGDRAGAYEARAEFGRYMAELIERKRARPGEDVVSDLVAAQAADPTFDDDKLVNLCRSLLFAGHETTVNRIDLGLLFLLTERDRWTALTADPAGRTDATVEEVLRLGGIGDDLGLLRYAHTDIDVAGVRIRRGDAVVLSVNAANRDPEIFSDGETFDPDRTERGHVGFGHGGHSCIGSGLARSELRAVFRALATRLPGLRLAAALDELALRPSITGGTTTLPVTW